MTEQLDFDFKTFDHLKKLGCHFVFVLYISDSRIYQNIYVYFIYETEYIFYQICVTNIFSHSIGHLPGSSPGGFRKFEEGTALARKDLLD